MPMPPETQPDSEASAAAVPVLNIANVLTVLRVVLVPVFIVVLFTEGGHETSWRIAAFGVFALAIATDRFDGVLARRYGLVTPFGQLADPIADKALIGAALIGLSVLGDLPWWITVVILVREIGITLLRLSVLRHGVIPANRGGKLKTMVQSLAIAGYLLPLTGYWHTTAVVLMWMAVALTVMTGADYLAQALRPRPQTP
ncbi:CDP-diacylglycerol--glycerol-3-phosphate 3-phosphatidyltransferase [Mycobacterium sp. CBMA271]|uniref:CDP-diacylglycerol--glycerol-3-phosphate 3-phosphatidyltransferase n=1 Tax=unclassified Mycobacteroides TaxID=2618759 RepID=UPI00132AD6EC|nr:MULTISPECIES: CDP-diacylglycerol--glycerol-3-phosphate 3-phosphatidyltransferase [unclassified Mycobacteroides]MUM17232.1 CDP-diacylglycerol--glycerol-3-phosphate 3-phosphatidyltransferase [Mycobacteroides sp. CBMA 326]MUM23938.1 CDP-diacylglycerol--glycerol-3-phosphate 3-phosphatidyltransferase [Mycobacteroides sp. CBMA 271]